MAIAKSIREFRSELTQRLCNEEWANKLFEYLKTTGSVQPGKNGFIQIFDSAAQKIDNAAEPIQKGDIICYLDCGGYYLVLDEGKDKTDDYYAAIPVIYSVETMHWEIRPCNNTTVNKVYKSDYPIRCKSSTFDIIAISELAKMRIKLVKDLQDIDDALAQCKEV